MSVILLKLKKASTDGEECWKLIGDIYVYGVMEGEAVRSGSTQTLKSTETVSKT